MKTHPSSPANVMYSLLFCSSFFGVDIILLNASSSTWSLLIVNLKQTTHKCRHIQIREVSSRFFCGLKNVCGTQKTTGKKCVDAFLNIVSSEKLLQNVFKKLLICGNCIKTSSVSKTITEVFLVPQT